MSQNCPVFRGGGFSFCLYVRVCVSVYACIQAKIVLFTIRDDGIKFNDDNGLFALVIFSDFVQAFGIIIPNESLFLCVCVYVCRHRTVFPVRNKKNRILNDALKQMPLAFEYCLSFIR